MLNKGHFTKYLTTADIPWYLQKERLKNASSIVTGAGSWVFAKHGWFGAEIHENKIYQAGVGVIGI